MAISTPVPKCLQKKKTLGGILRPLNFLAARGNPAPARISKSRVIESPGLIFTKTRECKHKNYDRQPPLLSKDLGWSNNVHSPMTWIGKSYTFGGPVVPHFGFALGTTMAGAVVLMFIPGATTARPTAPFP